MSRYRTYGELHGTAMFHDLSEPDVDRFLKHMEARLPAHGIEDYLEGFMCGKLGECVKKYRIMGLFRKKGSDDCKGDE